MAKSKYFRGHSHTRTVLFVFTRLTKDGPQSLHILPIAKVPGTLEDVTNMLVGARNVIPTSPATQSNPSLPEISAPERVHYFDWAVTPRSKETGVVSFPEPGIILAIEVASEANEEIVDLVALQFKHQILQAHPGIIRFLDSPDSRFIPKRYTEADVFISYSSKDRELADEMKKALEDRGKSAFLAEHDIQAGARWEPKIRSALAHSQIVVLLMTPNSLQSAWVIFEAGAAWALDIPIVSATSYIGAEPLPAAIPNYQARPFATMAQRTALIEEIVKVLSGFEN